MADAAVDIAQVARQAVAAARQSTTEAVEPVPFPKPMGRAAFHGIAGEFVDALLPHTEAAPEVLLGTLLVAIGSAIGRGPHVRVGADEHHPNLFMCACGRTSRGRKGTSLSHILRMMRTADSVWHDTRFVSGLRSGEGLIYNVRDPTERKRKDGTIQTDEGEPDKRLLACEEEFASVVKSMSRDGSTVSPVIRCAWDRGTLRTLSKHEPDRATGAHVSILAHVTRDELQKVLNATELANGFANRFIFIGASRSKSLPDGGGAFDHAEWGQRFRDVILRARQLREIKRIHAARDRWHAIYPSLTRERPGVLGAVTSRSEAQVLRLALVYALLDNQAFIDLPHLDAALAFWRFSADTCAWIWGSSTGNADADAIVAGLKKAGLKENGSVDETKAKMTRTAISRTILGGNRDSKAIDAALTVLVEGGMVSVKDIVDGGRSTEWVELISGFSP